MLITNKIKRFFLGSAVILMAVMNVQCGGSSTEADLDVSGSSGTLDLKLSDAATDLYKAVYVTVAKVQVKLDAENEEPLEEGNDVSAETEGQASGWVTVATPMTTINLLELVNGVRAQLALTSVASGSYGQMRLILGNKADGGINILSQAHPFANYVIDVDNEIHALKVPSGFQTGIKIVRGFTISPAETTEIVLDFDAAHSVVVAGSSGKYLLKPVIRVMTVAEAALVNGRVTRISDGASLSGAVVSAQRFNAGADDPKNEVVVEAATVSELDGSFEMLLSPGTYTLVAAKTGFAASTSGMTLTAGDVFSHDFSLSASETGVLSGTVEIEGADDETYATISVRQNVVVDGENVKIEVASINVASGGNFSMTLPVGTYEMVSSTFGRETQVDAAVVIAVNLSTTTHVAF